MAQYKIPFNRATQVENQVLYLQQAIANGHISGDGSFTKKCHEWLEESLGVAKALLTTSCTDALEMAAILLDFQPGDEVIVPSFTFVSTVNAFVLRGARPVFVDCRSDTLNLDETQLEELISDRVKAIVPVHYGGVGCEMGTIMEIAGRYGIHVVEDNAQGLLGKYNERYLGTFGALATQSFHETKNFTCGEGGALLINDPALTDRAEIIREKGTNRSRFFRGLVDKYTWVDIGSSYLPSELLAAFLCAQFEQREWIQGQRRRIWETYHERLADWAEEHQVRLPFVPDSCEQSYHLYYLLLPSLRIREALREYLKQCGILAVFHYQPLHLSEMGRRFGGREGDYPVTEDIADRLLRLPFYTNMSAAEQEYVIEALFCFENWG